MESVLSFAAICGAIAVGAMSPGPSFLVVARAALSNGRHAGLSIALGMALAGSTYALLAVLGLAGLITATPLLFTAVKVFGACYLTFIGVTMIRHAKEPLGSAGGGIEGKAGFWVGFATQISNPKTIVVYTSVFAALLPRQAEAWLLGALPLSIGLIEGLWYAVVASLFAGAGANKLYSRVKISIDRVSGTLMILLAMRLAWPG